MSNQSEALLLLRDLLNDPNAVFREGQWEAIDALVNRRERLLLVQRTGWGKSAIYFVATRNAEKSWFRCYIASVATVSPDAESN